MTFMAKRETIVMFYVNKFNQYRIKQNRIIDWTLQKNFYSQCELRCLVSFILFCFFINFNVIMTIIKENGPIIMLNDIQYEISRTHFWCGVVLGRIDQYLRVLLGQVAIWTKSLTKSHNNVTITLHVAAAIRVAQYMLVRPQVKTWRYNNSVISCYCVFPSRIEETDRTQHLSSDPSTQAFNELSLSVPETSTYRAIKQSVHARKIKIGRNVCLIYFISFLLFLHLLSPGSIWLILLVWRKTLSLSIPSIQRLEFFDSCLQRPASVWSLFLPENFLPLGTNRWCLEWKAGRYKALPFQLTSLPNNWCFSIESRLHLYTLIMHIIVKRTNTRQEVTGMLTLKGWWWLFILPFPKDYFDFFVNLVDVAHVNCHSSSFLLCLFFKL